MTAETIRKKRKILAPFSLILILFVLRYPLLFLGAAEVIPSDVAFVIYVCLTYLFSGVFIVLNRNELEKYNITKVSLCVFFIAPIIAIVMGNDYDPTLWIRFIMAIMFAVVLVLKRQDLSKSGKISIPVISINIVITILLCMAIPVLIHIMQGFPTIDMAGSTPELAYFDIKKTWFFQLSSAAISEEPLFRGFLWGVMKEKKVKDLWICLAQVVLFWAGHIYYIDTGINFWIIHPFVALVLGLLVWKTKSITTTMILHSSINTFVDYLRFVPLLK